MSGRIPRQFIDDLLVRVDIVDLIGSHIPLKKVGSNFVALCPFHTEKTPSFSVSRNRQMYHCFGCGASGNAISFLMDYSHLGFVEAVEDLATFVGVDVPREKGNNHVAVDQKDVFGLYALLESVAAFYSEQLRSFEGEKAVEYLKQRGIGGEIARDFGLGYAPAAWDAVMTRFDRDVLIEAGMLVVRDDGKIYDRFRGRLMFPIRDKRKRVVGFGGRVLDDSLPKYLNSPETAIFSKSKELYGLCELLQSSARPERILVVEGYMDVISLAQCGIFNAVATLGTATSKYQIELLFRYTSEIIFCFDGDNAGRKAAWKAVEVALACLRDGKQIKIMLLPQGHDPDSLVREFGVIGFQQQMNNARVLSDYFFDFLTEQLNLSSMEGRAQLMVSAKPLLEKMPGGVFKEMMWRRLVEMTGLSGMDVPKKQSILKSRAVSGDARSKQRSSLVRRVLALLVQEPKLECVVAGRDTEFEGLKFAGHELFKDLLRKIAIEKPKNSAILLESYRGTPYEKTVKALAGLELNVPDEGKEAEFSDALTQLLKQSRQEKLSELLAKEGREGLSVEEKQTLRMLLEQRLLNK